MLKKIEIENFLTIEKCVLEPSDKITAIIGESGSGKSLIIKAVDSVFSQKVDTSIVGKFADFSKISLLFQLSDEQKRILFDFGIFENQVVFTKVIKKGATRILINHEPVTAKIASSLKNLFLSIVSQDYRFEIFSSNRLLGTIDTHVEKSIIDDFMSKFYEYENIKGKISNIEETLKEITDKHPEILLEAIEKVNPKKGEYDELLDKLNRVKNSRLAMDVVKEAVFELYEKDKSIEDFLNRLISDLNKLETQSFKFSLKDTLNEALELIRSIRDEFYNVLNQNFSEIDSDKINARLFQLEKLKREFGKDLDEIIEQKEYLRSLIDEKEEILKKIDDLKRELENKERIMVESAENLSKWRKKVAGLIENRIKEHLSELNMENSRVKIFFNRGKVTRFGFDRVDVLFSANPDIELDSIDKVASGGEKSRFILALKVTLSELSRTSETVIFDEIESGLSNKALEKLMVMMGNYSGRNQILLVTHSDKMLEVADRIYRIDKKFVEGKSISTLERVR